MEAATGDKEFWVVDVVGNFCFVHPAKAGISSNLNLITDKGNIYSASRCRMFRTPRRQPDLKVLIQPADRSSIVASTGPPQFVPAAQLEQSQAATRRAAGACRRRRSTNTRARIRLQLKFDYSLQGQRGAVRHSVDLSRRQVHLHQDHCAREVQRLRDEGRQAESGQLRPSRRNLHHSQGHGFRLRRTRQEAHGFLAQGIMAMTESEQSMADQRSSHSGPTGADAEHPRSRRVSCRRISKPLLYLGAALLVILAAVFSWVKKRPPTQSGGSTA